jgi:hypothetical protein
LTECGCDKHDKYGAADQEYAKSQQLNISGATTSCYPICPITVHSTRSKKFKLRHDRRLTGPRTGN